MGGHGAKRYCGLEVVDNSAWRVATRQRRLRAMVDRGVLRFGAAVAAVAVAASVVTSILMYALLPPRVAVGPAASPAPTLAGVAPSPSVSPQRTAGPDARADVRSYQHGCAGRHHLTSTNAGNRAGGTCRARVRAHRVRQGLRGWRGPGAEVARRRAVGRPGRGRHRSHPLARCCVPGEVHAARPGDGGPADRGLRRARPERRAAGHRRQGRGHPAWLADPELRGRRAARPDPHHAGCQRPVGLQAEIHRHPGPAHPERVLREHLHLCCRQEGVLHGERGRHLHRAR